MAVAYACQEDEDDAEDDKADMYWWGRGQQKMLLANLPG